MHGMDIKSFLIVIFGLLVIEQAIGSETNKNASIKIDHLVSQKLDELGIPPSEVCTDAIFLRRVFLDVIGTLPTEKEARDFLKDTRADKRARLINDLLNRPEFADYWSLKWGDLLRVKAEFPSKLWPNAVQAYHRWIHTALKENQPYNTFARALLTSSGSNFRDAPVNFYRAVPSRTPEELARAVALTFMGVRLDTWKPERRQGFAAFFGQVAYKSTAEWKEEIVFFDPSKTFLDPKTKKPIVPTLPDGTQPKIPSGEDPRKVFADWLVNSNDFSRCMVNRIWFWLLGRGIVQEPDDFRPDNPPQNPQLLDFLAKELKTSHYNIQHIFRIILNSKTYQRSAIHNEGNLSDKTNFSHYYVRRLGAEVLIDALCQITKTTETYSSAIPEPFTWIPKNQRSILLADGSITSPFLELYGRPPRDTGYESERNNKPSSAQKLYLLNSTQLQKKILNNPQLLGIQGNRKKQGKKKGRKKRKAYWKPLPETLDSIYLTILSRYPTPEERKIVIAYIKESKIGRRNATIDVVWALLNTKEFIYKH
jgi:hypothetical protein